MLSNYFILVATISMAALVWRALLIDHPAFLERVQAIPLIGAPLTCGFCSALWFSLAGVLLYNPLAAHFFGTTWIVGLFLSWSTVGLGVLFTRNLVALLIESVGVLSHIHHESHK